MLEQKEWEDAFGKDYVSMSLRDALKCVIWYCDKEGQPFDARVRALTINANPWEEIPPRWWMEWVESL